MTTTTTTTTITRYDETAPINIWIGNLRKYNEGELSGDWIALPLPDGMDSGDVFAALGIDLNRDEYFIADYDTEINGLDRDEYADIDELSEQAQEWLALDDDERAAVSIRMELCNEDFAEAMQGRDDVRIWHGCRDMGDVAQEYAEECGLLDSMPDNLRYYFDFDALGRDMEIEGTFDYSPELGCMVEVIW